MAIGLCARRTFLHSVWTRCDLIGRKPVSYMGYSLALHMGIRITAAQVWLFQLYLLFRTRGRSTARSVLTCAVTKRLVLLAIKRNNFIRDAIFVRKTTCFYSVQFTPQFWAVCGVVLLISPCQSGLPPLG